MKLKSYPGYAIDANFSVGNFNSMGVLYEANWKTTNYKTDLNKEMTPSKSNQNLSSLSYYQERVDKLRELEANDHHRKKITNIGYRPSTLRTIKAKLSNSNDWDCDIQKQENTPVLNPLYNHSQNNWHSSDYLSTFNTNSKGNEPSIKRSQTVIVKQPTPTRHYNKEHMFEFGSFLQNQQDFSNNSKKKENIHSEFKNNCDKELDCDNMYKCKRINKNTLNDANTENNFDLTNGYNTMYLQTFNEGKVELPNHGFATETLMPNSLYNSQVIEKRSTKSDDFDVNSLIKGIGKITTEGAKTKSHLSVTDDTEVKREKKSGFSKLFYNTISTGSKLPKVLLGRSKSQKNQRPNISIKELSENFERNSNDSTKSNQSSSLSTTSSIPHSPRKKSPMTFNSDTFSIPRPRLIVPVHSYTRKRRTGNLIKDQSASTNNGSVLSLKQII